MTLQGSIVKETLQGKHVLITGCTGFLGKVVLEKLIRSTPDLASITLLVRAGGRFQSAEERAKNDVFASSVFSHLKSLDESAFEDFYQTKVKVLEGQLTEPRFGLSREDFESLADQIDVIVNSAASVDFREPLDQALAINTLSLNSIVALSKLGNIPVVQVSTCYVNGFNKGDMFEETHGPANRKISRNGKGQYVVEGLIHQLQDRIVASVDPTMTKAQQKQALVNLGIEQAHKYGWNDTYTFTKWLGEQLLIEKLSDSSLVILRPAIIESTLRAPVPGWIEGIKVADAIVFAYARGKMEYFPANPHGVMDIIPADLVANSVILSMVKAIRSSNETHIYQCCSSSSNPVTVAELKRAMVDEAQANHKSYPKLFKQNKPAKEFTFVSKSVFQLSMKAAKVPLGLLDEAKSVFGLNEKKSQFHKNIDTAITLSETFSFYTFPKYRFHNGKLLALAAELGENADGEFPVDAKLIKWKKYFGQTHLAGLERYAVHEQAKTALVKKAPSKAKSKKKVLEVVD